MRRVREAHERMRKSDDEAEREKLIPPVRLRVGCTERSGSGLVLYSQPLTNDGETVLDEQGLEFPNFRAARDEAIVWFLTLRRLSFLAAVAPNLKGARVVVCAASRLITIEPVSTGMPPPLLMASHSEASFSHVAWSARLGAIAAIR